MLAKAADHGPYAKEINFHWDAKGLLVFFSELDPRFVSALVEAVSEGDLFIVVPSQQTDLVSGKFGGEIKF